MAINLKNYTSTVPASTSMSNIEKYLVAAGATDISKTYKDQVCIGIRFRIIHKTAESPNLGVPLFFELPAKIDACFKVLYAEVKRPNSETRQRIMKQAEITAWKIIADWVQIQLAMIQLDQAELLQIFLPYAWNPNTQKTYFETIKDAGYKALLGN